MLLSTLPKLYNSKAIFAEAYYNRGNAYSNKNDFDSAIGDYNTAIALKPNYTDAYYNRGVAYREQGETDRAIWRLYQSDRTKSQLC